MKAEDLLAKLVRATLTPLMMGSICLALYGMVLLGYQGLWWLRTGAWVPLPAAYLFIRPGAEDVLSRMSLAEGRERDTAAASWEGFQRLRQWTPSLASASSEQWLRSPSPWLGLHKIVVAVLNNVSIPACAVLGGIASFALAVVILGNFEYGLQQSRKAARRKGGPPYPIHPDAASEYAREQSPDNAELRQRLSHAFRLGEEAYLDGGMIGDVPDFPSHPEKDAWCKGWFCEKDFREGSSPRES